MAGAGYKLFATGDVLSASDVNTYIMQQTVMVFANSTARTTALSSVLAEGMVSYLQDTNSLEVYDGTAWVGATGDITGLTAGTGVSITSATGPVPTVGIDTAVVPRLGVANSFTAGPQTLNTGAAGSIGLIVKGAASQTANLQEWQSDTSSIYAAIRSSGRFDAYGGAYIATGAVGTVGLYIDGAASQSANLQEWRNNSGVALARIRNSGAIIHGSLITGTAFAVNLDLSGASAVGAIIRGAGSQTADLQQWQNSGGTVLISINSAGDLLTPGGSARAARFRYFDGTNATGTYIDTQLVTNSISLIGRSTTAVTTIVRGAASQTADLQQWQNSAGTVLASVDASGRLIVGNTVGLIQVTSSGTSGSFPSTGSGIEIIAGTAAATDTIQAYNRGTSQWRNLIIRSAKTLLQSNFTTNVVLTVQGTASQTANLTEWQDSSGNVLARVTNGGELVGQNIQTATAYATLVEESSGGRIRLTKLSTAATNPGANMGKLYFRDGTNAGTLKLVVRAGASGAETTILDNIPQ